MQCGPIRYRVDAKEQAAAHPFEHTVFVRPTGFRSQGTMNPDMRMQFHDLYDQLIKDEARSRLIVAEVIQSVRNGRSPVVLTERNEHLDQLAECLTGEDSPCRCSQRRYGQKGTQVGRRSIGGYS